jgi:hypothetical protein
MPTSAACRLTFRITLSATPGTARRVVEQLNQRGLCALCPRTCNAIGSKLLCFGG